jgi:hypothetical protein
MLFAARPMRLQSLQLDREFAALEKTTNGKASISN